MSFQYLQCRPLDQVCMMRLHGNVRTAVKEQLSRIQEQTSLWFLSDRKPTGGRLGVGGFATDGASVETTRCPPSKIAYLLWQMSQVNWSAAGRKKCLRCFIEKRPTGRRDCSGALTVHFLPFSDSIFGKILCFLLNTSSKKFERDPENEKRRHPFKFQSLSGLNVSIIFLKYRFTGLSLCLLCRPKSIFRMAAHFDSNAFVSVR